MPSKRKDVQKENKVRTSIRISNFYNYFTSIVYSNIKSFVTLRPLFA